MALDRDAIGRRRVIEGFDELDLITGGESHRRRAERSRANLWTGDVDHDGQLGREGTNATQALDTRRDVAVGEGKSEDVNTGHHQGLDDLVTV